MAAPKTVIFVQPMTPGAEGNIRTLLEAIGWDENYVRAQAANAAASMAQPETHAALAAHVRLADVDEWAGFIFVELHAWNRLAQIQGLAVHPRLQRQGVASALVAAAEVWARRRRSRGIFVDTPTTNFGACAFYQAAGYRPAYVMPSYYEDGLDGITFQRFFADRQYEVATKDE